MINLLLLTYFLFGYSIMLNKKSFSGALCNNCEKCLFGYVGGGAIIYENNNDGSKNFILGVNNKNNLVDFGGKVANQNERIWTTVSGELYKQSNKFFNIDDKKIIEFNYVNVKFNQHKYRCYFIEIEKKNNKNTIYKIRNEDFLKNYNEIINIISIPENKIKKLLYDEYEDLNKSNELIPYILSNRLKKIFNIYFEE